MLDNTRTYWKIERELSSLQRHFDALKEIRCWSQLNHKRNEAYSDRIKSMASKYATALRFKAMDNHIIASLIKSTNWKFCRIRRIRNGVMRFNENTNVFRTSNLRWCKIPNLRWVRAWIKYNNMQEYRNVQLWCISSQQNHHFNIETQIMKRIKSG